MALELLPRIAQPALDCLACYLLRLRVPCRRQQVRQQGRAGGPGAYLPWPVVDGGLPLERRLVRVLSVSNQKCAPSETAAPVRSKPTSLDRKNSGFEEIF